MAKPAEDDVPVERRGAKPRGSMLQSIGAFVATAAMPQEDEGHWTLHLGGHPQDTGHATGVMG